MPSVNKTSNLKLNLWEPTDRPMRNDFVSDNILIDAAVGEHIKNSTLHLSAEEKAYIAGPMAVMSYTGNGESERVITLNEKVKLVIVFAQNKPVLSSTKVYFSMGYAGLGSASGLSVNSNGLEITVSQTTDSLGNVISLNESGTSYKVIMLK